MLCQKTNTQSHSEGLVEKSVENRSQNESSQQQGGTGGLAEDQSWYLRVIKGNPERLERYKLERKEYRIRAKEKIKEYHKNKWKNASESEKERTRNTQRKSYYRNHAKQKAKLRNLWLRIKSDKVRLGIKNARKKSAYHAARKNPEKLKEMRLKSALRARERRRSDSAYRLQGSCRALIVLALKRAFTKKAHRTAALVGCSYLELRRHIESQWSDGMDWSNYGRVFGMWCIDHIRPCASFDLTDPDQQMECFNWKNLRPLWVIENQRKSSYWNGLQYRSVKSSKP